MCRGDELFCLGRPLDRLPEGPFPLIARILLVALLLLPALPAAAREKVDTLIMRNGDHFTGEIKGMSRGKLDLSTDDVGRISVEWAKVARVTSPHPFEVELRTGERSFGALSSPIDFQLAVGALPTTDVMAMSEVVEIIPMEDAFLGRVRASFDLGFTLAKAHWATTVSTAGEFSYRDQALGAKLTFDGYFQVDDTNNLRSGTAVSRGTIGLLGEWYFENSWRTVLGFLAEHNQELDLVIRLSISPGVAHSVVRNGWTELWITGGLAGSREVYSNADPNYELDALVAATWTAFQYDHPKLASEVTLVLLPGLSDFGRLRGTFTAKVKYEVFRDFNVGITFTDTFDTRPPNPTSPNNDFITTLTIGWTYRK